MANIQRTKIITKEIALPIRGAFKGVYHWEVLKNGEIVSKGSSENLILDQFLNGISPVNGNILEKNANVLIDRLRVGTGTLFPSVGDTGLVNEIANTTTQLNVASTAQLNPLDNSQLLESIAVQFQFDLGAIDTNVSGSIRELGISDNENRFLSRVVVSPGIDVDSDQQLRLTYEVQGIISITDRQNFALTIPGLGSFSGNTPSAGKGLFNYSTYSSAVEAFTNMRYLTSPTRLSVMPTTTSLGTFAIEGADANTVDFTGSLSSSENGSLHRYLAGTAQSYTNGTFSQQVNFRFTSNNAWTTPAGGFVLRNAFMFKFDAGQSFTKDDQTILDLIFTASWGRL